MKRLPTVLLLEPQMANNIGSSARAMLNFGLKDLRVINPRDGWPQKDAYKMASGANEVLDNAQAFSSLKEALADLHFVLALTARPRDMVKPLFTPRQAAEILYEKFLSNLRVGILFGQERSGLVNEDLMLCDGIITIPSNPDFSSLNLAQAVLIFGYEWFEKIGGKALELSLAGDEKKPVTKEDLYYLLEHLEKALDEKGFFRIKEKRFIMIQTIYNIFTRVNLTEQETRTLRGVINSLMRPIS